MHMLTFRILRGHYRVAVPLSALDDLHEHLSKVLHTCALHNKQTSLSCTYLLFVRHALALHHGHCALNLPGFHKL